MIGSSRLVFASGVRPVGLRYGARAVTAAASILRPAASLPRPRVEPRAGRHWGRRWESTPAAAAPAPEQNVGHIVPAADESILFFDNIFPLGVGTIFWRKWNTEEDLSGLLDRFENSSVGITGPISLVKRAIPASLPIKVTEVIPRLKDGGAFVKFSHAPDASPRDFEKSLAKSLADRPIKPWFNPFASVRVSLVQGVPWLEDLYRLPSARLKVEFCPPSPDSAAAVELSQETLYSLFRRYGKLAEITPQPFDSKVTPRYAHVDFASVRDAVMARNCMHGFTVGERLGGGRDGTKLRLSYEQKVKAHHIWNWLTSHPRIVIPLVAALLAAVTVVVFDPIREFFIRAHIQGSFRVSNSRLYRWLKRQTEDIVVFARRRGHEQPGLQALWSQRRDIIDSVQTWLMETADTFIVVQGPRGSGTRELIIDQALEGRPNVLVVDCKPVVEARGESATIRRLAAAVGYRPVFSWANSLSSLVDLAVQGTTGVKAGFSETLESQIVKILHTTASALKKVSLADHGRRGADGQDGGEMSEDAYLEAHPERRAVVVIDNFLHKHDEGGLVYDKVAEWAAALVQSNIAHVVFLTNDSTYSKSLSKSLPDRVFRQVALGDLSPEVAKKYVLSHLEGLDRDSLAGIKEGGENDIAPSQGEKDQDKTQQHQQQQQQQQESKAWEDEGVLRRWYQRRQAEPQPSAEGGEVTLDSKRRRELAELDSVIDTLGGRLTDLEFLARRLKSGQTPKHAVAEIVEQSSAEIVKMFLLGGKKDKGAEPSSGARDWSPEQAWYLIKEIAARSSLRYNEVLLSGTFASSTTASAADGEAAVEALAAAELVTVTSHRGRPQTIRAGRPVYQAAFGLLASDVVLAARMDLAVLAELAKVEAAGIAKAESELALLGQLPRQPRETADRVNYLLAKLQAGQAKIVVMEKEMAALKKVLTHEV